MKIYVVRRGDTLFRIARHFGLSTEEVAGANQLQNPSVLAVGQALIIPTELARHSVARGESVYAIARLYQVSPEDILAANPSIGSGSRIYPGQVLEIPFSRESLGTAAVNGYVTNSTSETLETVLPYLTWLSPFSFRTDSAGELSPTYSVPIKESAANRTDNLLTVTNLKEQGGFSGDIAHAVLTDSEVQENFLQNLFTALARGDWSGVNLDFEYVYPFDRKSYNQFLLRLAERLHDRGYLLVTALAPKTSGEQTGLLYSAHDYAAHGTAADYVVLMTYEWGYTYGPAMAVAPINMVRRVLDYAVTVIPRGKILLGIPNYGYDWTLPYVRGTAAAPLSSAGAIALAGRVGAEIHFDALAQSPYFHYTDADGNRHEVWFEDVRSLSAKYRLIAEYGLAGLSFWNLNRPYSPAFLVLGSMYDIEKVQ